MQVRHADRTESYIYDPNVWWSPLARITQRPGDNEGDIRWFNTDLNGAPLEMTDADGAVRWSGDYSSFGAVNGQTQDSEGLRHDKPMESQPLRYAGQYADDETGLHYNLFRYYDPTVGRFTTQDPIGLAGGINLYQYAPNPLGWVDPFGLSSLMLDPKDINFSQTSVNKNFDIPKEVADQLGLSKQKVNIDKYAKVGSIPVEVVKDIDELREFNSRLKRNGLPNNGTNKLPSCR
ncbi:hypothetical protein BJJ97_05515 [Pectobacterium polaris]|nr:hypothetical protein BJJ97_05515 [Pectobacterium polaris]